MAVTHQAYGYMNDKYYTVPTCQNIIVPEEMDIKTNAIQTQIDTVNKTCNIDIFRYHSDLITEDNAERVAFMKEYLIDKKITEIDAINEDFVLLLDYDIFNCEGKVIRSGTTAIQAVTHNLVIIDEVDSDNELEYRKAYVLDSSFEIELPRISKYGIYNSTKQYPYTIKLNGMKAFTTTGDYKYIKESNTMIDTCRNDHYSTLHYKVHHPCNMSLNNFSSRFITNARIGTTLIDQFVVSGKLQIDDGSAYHEVTIMDIPFSGNEYIIKVDSELSLVTINMEVVVDNLNVVYDKADIDAILDNNKDPDVEPDPDPVDPDPDDPDNPDNNSNDDANGDTFNEFNVDPFNSSLDL